MALLDSEVQRIRYELGYPNLNTAAEPYIGIVAVFTQVIQPYLLGGAATTSLTPVSASSAPTPVTIALADGTGFSAGSIVIVDVDSRQERATVQSITGASMTIQLSLAHSGTYPVTLEGGESIVRDILKELRAVSDAIIDLKTRVGLKAADDLQFFGGGQTLASQGVDPLTQTLKLREYWRDELARCLGLPRLNAPNSNGGSDVSVY
jgi:hypothetical protein